MEIQKISIIDGIHFCFSFYEQKKNVTSVCGSKASRFCQRMLAEPQTYFPPPPAPTFLDWTILFRFLATGHILGPVSGTEERRGDCPTSRPSPKGLLGHDPSSCSPTRWWHREDHHSDAGSHSVEATGVHVPKPRTPNRRLGDSCAWEFPQACPSLECSTRRNQLLLHEATGIWGSVSYSWCHSSHGFE